MFTSEQVEILIEIAKNYKEEQLKQLADKEKALKWWSKLSDIAIGHGCAPTKQNYSYMHYKCHYSGLTDMQIIHIWEKHAIK